MVVWRLHGGRVQVMDPARGRRWVRRRELLSEVYLHENRVPAEAFRGWAESDGFRDPLLARLRRLGVPRPRARFDEALAVPGWQGVAALDAATRATEALVDRGALRPGAGRRRRCDALFADARASRRPGQSLHGRADLLDRARHPGAGNIRRIAETLIVRGAIAVRVPGAGRPGAAARRPRAAAAASWRASHRRRASPGRRRSCSRCCAPTGCGAWPPLLAGLLLAAGGAVFEALLFRGFLDVGRRLPLVEQRLAAGRRCCCWWAALLCIEWPVVARAAGASGGGSSCACAAAFADKIPRVGDRYFQSRPSRTWPSGRTWCTGCACLPGQGGQLVRAAGELVVTTAGIIWLHPPSAPIALALAAAMVALPLLFQPALVERDLRMRNHAGGLARFYLDALMGLVAIRAHAAEAGAGARARRAPGRVGPRRLGGVAHRRRRRGGAGAGGLRAGGLAAVHYLGHRARARAGRCCWSTGR